MQREYQYNYNNYLRVENLNKDYRVNSVDFASKGYDEDLDLDRMGHRYMDSGAKRFITPDPLFMESPEKCVESPFECNLYSYAGGNPAMGIDPEGLELILEGEHYNRVKYKDIKKFSKKDDQKILTKSKDLQHVYAGMKLSKLINNKYLNNLYEKLDKLPVKIYIRMYKSSKNYAGLYVGSGGPTGKDGKRIIKLFYNNIKDMGTLAATLDHELGHAWTELIKKDLPFLTENGNELRSVNYENIVLKFLVEAYGNQHYQITITVKPYNGPRVNALDGLSDNPDIIPNTKKYRKNPINDLYDLYMNPEKYEIYK